MCEYKVFSSCATRSRALSKSCFHNIYSHSVSNYQILYSDIFFLNKPPIPSDYHPIMKKCSSFQVWAIQRSFLVRHRLLRFSSTNLRDNYTNLFPITKKNKIKSNACVRCKVMEDVGKKLGKMKKQTFSLVLLLMCILRGGKNCQNPEKERPPGCHSLWTLALFLSLNLSVFIKDRCDSCGHRVLLTFTPPWEWGLKDLRTKTSTIVTSSHEDRSKIILVLAV